MSVAVVCDGVVDGTVRDPRDEVAVVLRLSHLQASTLSPEALRLREQLVREREHQLQLVEELNQLRQSLGQVGSSNKSAVNLGNAQAFSTAPTQRTTRAVSPTQLRTSRTSIGGCREANTAAALYHVSCAYAATTTSPSGRCVLHFCLLLLQRPFPSSRRWRCKRVDSTGACGARART